MTWLDDFWSHVEVRGECWVWTGPSNGKGYGHIYVRGCRKMLAHRISYELATGDQVPSNMLVCHHCDNPPCVRPDHLFVGTTADNVHDMIRKGRSHRGSRILSIDGETLPAYAWAERTGISRQLLNLRLRNGVAPERAILPPVHRLDDAAGEALRSAIMGAGRPVRKVTALP